MAFLAVSTAGHLFILLFLFQLSFFLWIKLGLFLLFLFAFIFFSLIAHICFSFLENVLYLLTCSLKSPPGSAITLVTAILYSNCRLQIQHRPFYLKSKEKAPADYLEKLIFSSCPVLQGYYFLKIRSRRNKHPQYGQKVLLGLFLSVRPTRGVKYLSDFWKVFLDKNMEIWYK
jgi:hypothetical protein